MHSWQQVLAFHVLLQTIVAFLATTFLPELLVFFITIIAFLQKVHALL